DYAEINANRYAYMLEGADKDWIAAGTRRSASYIQVNPGDYVFRVKGTNNDGVWNEEGASVRVRILPPFWMTAQFQILMAIVGIAALITVYKLRTRSIKRQRNILQREVDERKVAESKLLSNQQRLRKLASELTLAEERERRRIAEGLHDQIGQNLAFTKRRLSSLGKESKDKLVSKSLEPVINLIGETINDTRSLTLEISPPILYQLGLKSALKWLVEHFKNQHGIPAKFKDDGLTKPLDENLPVLLFQSARELLFNVIKHAKANHLEVSMSRMDDNICISITDDGVGFDAETLSDEWKPGSGFGIFSIQERLNPFGGKLVIRSKPGEGTTSTLFAPLDTAHAELEE
ncbi:MAG: ATP-binding protein, partial [Chlorobiales bacterium]|nr:ATP-binding protein [Chlorobiales bacterium]